jgi:hypothetical protein
MPSTRLYIDPQARAVTTKAAASAEASLLQSAAIAPADQACSAPAATANAFDVAVAGAMTWARGGHEGVAAAVATRGAVTGAVSATGLNALETMNETNAVDLRTVAEQL